MHVHVMMRALLRALAASAYASEYIFQDSRALTVRPDDPRTCTRARLQASACVSIRAISWPRGWIASRDMNSTNQIYKRMFQSSFVSRDSSSSESFAVSESVDTRIEFLGFSTTFFGYTHRHTRKSNTHHIRAHEQCNCKQVVTKPQSGRRRAWMRKPVRIRREGTRNETAGKTQYEEAQGGKE
jgi:hypothetical protein